MSYELTLSLLYCRTFTDLVFKAGFKVGLAELNLGYPENPAKLSSLVFSYVGLSWVLKNYELGLAGFEKIQVGFSWVFWVSNTL